jgi:hypothetical protein
MNACTPELLEARLCLSAVPASAPAALTHTTTALLQPRDGPGAASVGTKALFSGGIDDATEQLMCRRGS